MRDEIQGKKAEEYAGKERIHVRVLFFGAARESAGRDEVQMELAPPATAESAYKEVLAHYPQLQERFGRSLLFAINQEYAALDQAVREDDELAVFPPVSGGARDEENGSADFFELTSDPIDVGQVARRVVRPECGATVTLDGYVREYTRNRKRTLYLIYEAYAAMALGEMQRLGRKAHTRFQISHIGIVHRTGRLEIGETSVVIAVSAPHRRSAFEACEWAITELKRTVPIWKKEIYEDGEVWIEGESAPQGLLLRR
jgi:molybdopterin synthase catalytic subunit